MSRPARRLMKPALIALTAACAVLTATSADAAMRHGGRMLTVKKMLIPAHLRPGYVGAPGYVAGPPGPVYPAFVDLGYGPVFPFGGWPR